MADTIKISLELADQAAQNALSNFIKNGQKADAQVNKLKDSGKNAFQEIGLSIGKTIGIYDIFAGNIAANVVTKGFEAITNSIATLISEASGSEQAIKNLNVALRQSGQYTEGASSELQEFAGILQEVTVYSDEAILSSATYLLNLTSLTKNGIEAATSAAVDLAATFNLDLNTATELIAKAVNGNTTGFKKMGIEIQSANTDAGRLDNVLKALSSQQGAAAAVTNTYAGAIEKAKNQQSEFFESVGKLLTQSPAVISGIEKQGSLYTYLAKLISDNTDRIRDFGTAMGITAGIVAASAAGYIAVSTAIGIMGVAAVTGTTAFGALGIAATATWAAITAPVSLVVAGIVAVGAAVYALVRNWDEVKAATYDGLAAFVEFRAKVASLVNNDKLEESLNKQALAYREQANSIRVAVAAAQEKAQQDAATDKVSEEQAKIAQQRRLEAQAEELRHATFLKETAVLNRQELLLINQEADLALLEQQELYNNEKELREGSFDVGRLEKMQQEGIARLTLRQSLDRQEFELQVAKQVAQANAESDELKKRESLRKVYDKSNIARIELQNKQELELEKQKLENQKKLDQDAIAARTNTLNLFASLSQENNSTLAAIGKAAGLTQIAIATPVAVGEAFKFGTMTGGPLLGGVFAGIAATAMAAQAAKLVGVKFANGGIVPGNSFSGDRVVAGVNSGEMVLNTSQQTQLFKIANGQSGAGMSERLDSLIESVYRLLQQPIVVNVDGKEIFNITREQLNSGRAF